MAWRNITVQNILGRLTVSENNMLINASGATSKLQERLTDAIGVYYSAMTAQSYSVGTPPAMCDRFRNEVMAMALWEWLLDFPQLKVFKTDERKRAYTDSKAMVDKIAMRLAGAIEPPGGVSITQNWNGANLIVGRMLPIPTPLQQYQMQGSPFPFMANPNAQSSSVLLQIPDPAKNCWVYTGAAGQLTINWEPPANAFVYSLYKGTATGNEMLYMAGITDTWFQDLQVTIGDTYFYYVVAMNAFGASANSNEAFGTVAAADSNN